MAVTSLKVIQGHHFWNQWEARTRYANNSNLRPSLHHFRDIADYWSNFRRRKGDATL